MSSARKTPPADGPRHAPRLASALDSARRTLAIESAAIDAVSRALDERVERAVDILASCAGKVVVVGMGKSGIICRKIAATLASTGTPASFLHAAEAVHGDFGVVGRDDVVLALSHSGETEEIVRLLPLIKRFSLPLIAITGGASSTLGRAADVTLVTAVPEEACPMGLAPTASTTAALALGDALAVALLERKGFSEEDFAVLHPAGSLGRKLLRVGELMHVGVEMPCVGTDTSLADAIVEMTSKRLGVTAVVAGDGRLVGIITDGDLRRAMGAARQQLDVHSITAADVMTANPQTIDRQALAAAALARMQERSITSLFVVEDGRPAGIVHLHDLLKAGIT